MSHRFLIETLSILGLFYGVVGILAYRPLLMRKVRNHPDINRSASRWRRVQHSLEMKSELSDSLYSFIKAYEARLRTLRWSGVMIGGFSALILVLSRLAR